MGAGRQGGGGLQGETCPEAIGRPAGRAWWSRWTLSVAIVVALGVPGRPAAGGDEPAAPANQSRDRAEEPAGQFQEEIKVVAPPIVEGDRLTPFASQVSSVSARQIEDLGAGDLAAALRRVPGVTISRYGLVGGYGGGDGGAVYVRGQGSGRPGAEIGTMIDGIPRFVGVWTHPLLDVLPTDTAERIDVYKSAQPVLFGNMAFAGINLVPKRVVHEGMATRISGSFGDHATGAGIVENGARYDTLDYYVLASQRASDGHRADAEGRVRTLYGRLGYELSEGWDLGVQVHSSDAWANDPGVLGAPPRGTVPRFGVEDTLSIATLSEHHGNHTGTVKVYHDSGIIDWRQWDGSKSHAFTTVTDFTSYGIKAQESVHLAHRTELVVGLEHDSYGGSTTEQRPTATSAFPELLLRNNSAWAMVARTFGTATEVTPSIGVRYTDASEFGGNWGGQAGLVVRRHGTELHANVARSFNLPGVYTAVNYRQWGLGDRWTDLEPELLDHAELGFSRQVTGAVRVQLTLFSDRVTDALRFVPPPPPPPMFANLGDYTVRGAEAAVTAAPNRKVALFAGATWLDPDPRTVPNAPQWSLVTGVSWMPADALRLNFDAEWVDTQAVLNPRYAAAQSWIESYLLVNMKAAYRLPVGTSLSTELFVVAENLTASEYEYRPGYPAPGRTMSVGVDVRF
jgi:iron complex outermembrane receptor protein